MHNLVKIKVLWQQLMICKEVLLVFLHNSLILQRVKCQNEFIHAIKIPIVKWQGWHLNRWFITAILSQSTNVSTCDSSNVDITFCPQIIHCLPTPTFWSYFACISVSFNLTNMERTKMLSYLQWKFICLHCSISE